MVGPYFAVFAASEWHARQPEASNRRRPSSALTGVVSFLVAARGERSIVTSPNPSFDGAKSASSYGVKKAFSLNGAPAAVFSDPPIRICIAGFMPGTATNRPRLSVEMYTWLGVCQSVPGLPSALSCGEPYL